MDSLVVNERLVVLEQPFTVRDALAALGMIRAAESNSEWDNKVEEVLDILDELGDRSFFSIGYASGNVAEYLTLLEGRQRESMDEAFAFSPIYSTVVVPNIRSGMPTVHNSTGISQGKIHLENIKRQIRNLRPF